MIAHTRRTGLADPLLFPPREFPYRLQDVFEKFVHGCRDELILDLGDCFLRFRVDIDTDEVVHEFHHGRFHPQRGCASVQSADPWKQHLNKNCGWTWLGMNQQGYMDSVMLSFDGIEPQILLQAIASSIVVFVIKPARKRHDLGKHAGKPNTRTRRMI